MYFRGRLYETSGRKQENQQEGTGQRGCITPVSF